MERTNVFLILILAAATTGNAQDAEPVPPPAPQPPEAAVSDPQPVPPAAPAMPRQERRRAELPLFDDGVSNTSMRRAAAESAALARRERAAYRARQRALRAEANAWLGISPLRPQWPSIPMMRSSYQPARIIYYPVFAD